MWSFIDKLLKGATKKALFDLAQKWLFDFLIKKIFGAALGGIWGFVAGIVWKRLIKEILWPAFSKAWRKTKRFFREKSLRKKGKKVVESKTDEEWDENIDNYLE
jgi:hypothetical protein